LDATTPDKVPFVFQRDASDGMLQSDLYGLLGVTQEATQKEVKKAGLNLLRIWHPDKLRETKPRLRYSWIDAAFQILTDEEGRRFWDERIAREQAREVANRERVARLRAKLEARRAELKELLAKRDRLLAERGKRRREQEAVPSEPAPEPVSPEGEAATSDPYGTPPDPQPKPLPKKRPRGSVGRTPAESRTRPKRKAPVLTQEQRAKAKQDLASGRAADTAPSGSSSGAVPTSASPPDDPSTAATSAAQEPETTSAAAAPSSASSSGPVPESVPAPGKPKPFRSTEELFRTVHLRFLQREAVLKKQKQHEEEQRRRAAQSEPAASSSGAAASATGSSSGSTRVQWAASESSVWGASAPAFDIVEPMEETYHNFSSFESFVKRYQELNPASEVRNTFNFLSLVWPDAKTSEIIVIETALQLAVEGQCVRVPWVAILDNDEPGEPPRHTRQVPPTYGVADSLNYFHGTPMYNLPGVRRDGLKPSDHGAGSRTQRLYTCKKRTAPLHTYSRHQELPIFKIDKSVVSKHFRCVLGIGSLSPWPYHAKKVPRKYPQFLHKPDMYQVMWVEFICSDDMSYDRAEDPKVNFAKERRRLRRVKRIAEAMIYPFERDEVGPAPPKRVKLLPQSRQQRQAALEDVPPVSLPESVRDRSDAPAPPLPESARGPRAASSASSSRNVAIGARAPSSPPPWRSNRRPSSKVDIRLLGRLDDETDDEEFWTEGDPEQLAVCQICGRQMGATGLPPRCDCERCGLRICLRCNHDCPRNGCEAGFCPECAADHDCSRYRKPDPAAAGSRP